MTNPKKMKQYFHVRAKKYEQIRDYNGAIYCYREAIELDPKDVVAYRNRGIAKECLEDYDEAISDFSKAIELDPEDPFAYLHRGKSKKSLDNKKGACEDWKQAAKLGNEEAEKLLKKHCK